MLDELNNVISLLKERMGQHREILSRSEAKTRYSLIDPLLTALGWDLSDPLQVQAEYHTGSGIADYMLLAGRATPQVVIEAKRLGMSVSEGVSQAIGYCLEQGVPYIVVTNGAQWEAYETHRMGPIAEKRIVEFSLAGETQPAVMKALWLWRGNFESALPVVPVLHSPVTDPLPPNPPIPSPPPPPPGTQLDAFAAQSRDARPAALVFPGQVTKSIERWSDLQVVVVEWLMETDRLAAGDCPVVTPNGAHIVHTSSTRANGSPFMAPVQVSGLWIDGNYSAPGHLRLAKLILQARGVDLATVLVQTR